MLQLMGKLWKHYAKWKDHMLYGTIYRREIALLKRVREPTDWNCEREEGKNALKRFKVPHVYLASIQNECNLYMLQMN